MVWLQNRSNIFVPSLCLLLENVLMHNPLKRRGLFQIALLCFTLCVPKANAQNALSNFGACISYYSNLRYPNGFLVYPGNSSITKCMAQLATPQQSSQPARYSRPDTSQQTYMTDRWDCYQQSGGICNVWASCLSALGYRKDPNGDLATPPDQVIQCSR